MALASIITSREINSEFSTIYYSNSGKAGEEELGWQGKNSEFSMFEFEQVLVATNNFSEENKLGQCGFGTVYKVILVCVYICQINMIA